MDPAALKVVELRAELRRRGLPAKGKKAQLIEALAAALAAEASGSGSGGAGAADDGAAATAGADEGAAAGAAAAAAAAADAAEGGADAAPPAAQPAEDSRARALDVQFGGVLPAGKSSVASQRVPQKTGLQPGEGSTRIRGTQRLARDSGSHEFFGPIVSAAPPAAKITISRSAAAVKLIHRPGITKSGRTWRSVRTQRSSTMNAMPQKELKRKQTSWEQKMRQKEEKKAMQAIQQQMRDERTALIEVRRLLPLSLSAARAAAPQP